MEKLPPDLHLHSRFCGHAQGELEDYIERAIRLGMPGVGFSFHLPVRIPVRYKVNLSREELDLVVGEVGRLRERYKGQIAILLGGEGDFIPGQEREVEDIAASYPFDYLIGSVHFLDGWAFDHPAEVARYADWDIGELYERYFGLVGEAIRSGLFDVVGHVDLIKKFGYRPEGDWSELVVAICEEAARSDTPIELNTAGFDKPAREQYASEDFLRLCARAGLPIVLGSDAHRPGEVGRHFPRAVELARRAGFETYAWFETRRRKDLTLQGDILSPPL